MGRETNIHSIQALERRIEEGNGNIIAHKRARNSLLNISICTPAEVLGCIFVWSLVQKARSPAYSRDFGGLQKGTYNFLLVCHRWFEVASRTPELWGFWGNTLQDWKKRHHRFSATPLDLVLYGDISDPRAPFDPHTPFDKSLHDAVRTRVARNTIRRVHLISGHGGTLTSIISSLTPNDEGGQNDNIKSIILGAWGITSVDVSNFFARSRLSGLRFLELCGKIQISSWDHLAFQTTLLTTLSLKINTPPPAPTITGSQLSSILTKNPNLQELTLSGVALPNVNDGSMPKIPLRNLKMLTLAGDFRHLFELLRQLVLPETLDRMNLSGSNSTAEDISQTLAPYIRDYFRRDARFQDKLEVFTSSSPDSISISAEIVCVDPIEGEQVSPHIGFDVFLTNRPPPDVLKQLFTELMALLPQERVVLFNAGPDLELLEEPFIAMPNIEIMTITNVELSKGFLQPNPDGPHANTKLLPSLEVLCLQAVMLNDDRWSNLVAFLTHQSLDGQPISLEMVGEFPHMSPEEMDEIEDLVEDFACGEGVRTTPDEQPYFGHSWYL